MRQGERAKAPEGTRQKSRRNFGICLAAPHFCSELRWINAELYAEHR